MKLSISRNTLQTSLQHLAKATPTRSTIPILSQVLFEAKENKLELRATDLEITVVIKTEASIITEGSIAIPHKTLIDITNALPETEIVIEVINNSRIIIQTTFGNYDISGSASEEFPSMPEVDNKKEINISSTTLKRLIDKTSFALSADELKPALMGALLEVKQQNIASIATDGHRLSFCARSDFSSVGYEGDVIIPKKFLGLILPYLEQEKKSTLWVGDNHVTVSFDQITIFSRIVDEQYPNYKAVLPVDNNKKILVDREELLSSVKRVSIFSNRSTRQVEITLTNNQAVVTTEDAEKATSAKETIEVEYNSENISLGFNANYLVDILSHLDTKKVKITMNTPTSAVLITPASQAEDEENTMLLMPMRTN
ncbi:MAG: DNA polymerase III subunit beta [Candidatus Marinimicrobia bacterium]|nr:DNA polymerase III subunit beta [Candidatus Neomarinimicrobiota bacterium]|tara:strand:+ start:80020 stop:81132 length:1113 start_codon:yes stop_codon:yes gene_type:complete